MAPREDGKSDDEEDAAGLYAKYYNYKGVTNMFVIQWSQSV